MELPRHIRMFRRMLDNIDRQRLEMGEREMRVPVSRYTDPAWFEWERNTLFRKYPLVVGHGSRLPAAGDCMTHDLLGLPMLLVRGEDGVLRAFLNQCAHRATRLLDAAEPTSVRRLMCPYHNWVYALDGRLERLPLAAEGFPNTALADRGLIPLPCAERQGLIWLLPTPGTEMDLDAWMGGIELDIAAFGIGGSVIYRQSVSERAANWKLVMDAFMESYHVKRLHRETVGPFFLDGQAVIERDGMHMIAAVARKEILQARGLPESAWDGRRHASHTLYFLPNTVCVVHPDYVSLMHMYPQAPDRTLIVHNMLIPEAPASDRARRHWERSFELIDGGVFNAEDFATAERMQAGIRAGGRDHLLIGRNEFSIITYQEILAELMEAGCNGQVADMEKMRNSS